MAPAEKKNDKPPAPTNLTHITHPNENVPQHAHVQKPYEAPDFPPSFFGVAFFGIFPVRCAARIMPESVAAS